MDKIIGAITGLILFAATLLIGIVRKVPTSDAILRALVCLAGGFLLGWMVFGRLGAAILKDSTKITEEEKGEGTDSKGTAASTPPTAT